MPNRNRWGSAILAGVLAEVAISVLIGASMAAYSALGHTKEGTNAFADTYAAWIASIASHIVTFFFAHRAVRPLAAGHMAHAAVVATVAVSLHLMMVVATMSDDRPFRWVYVLVDALKIAGAVAAAKLAKRNAAASVASAI